MVRIEPLPHSIIVGPFVTKLSPPDNLVLVTDILWIPYDLSPKVDERLMKIIDHPPFDPFHVPRRERNGSRTGKRFNKSLTPGREETDDVLRQLPFAALIRDRMRNSREGFGDCV